MKEIMDEADRNGDGKSSEVEFKRIMKKTYIKNLFIIFLLY